MKFDPGRLHVELRDGVTPTDPVIDRRYTLTHSDVTAELFLTIGLTYAIDKINVKRDEVLGSWGVICNQYAFHAICHVGGEKGKESAKKRYNIFRRELRLALESLRYGDRFLFRKYPYLDDSPIWIYFDSIYSEYNTTEYWGIFRDYFLGG